MKESTQIWNDAAKSLEFQGNFQGAVSCYERAKKFGDESTETLLNLAVSNIQLYEFYENDKYLELAKNFLISGLEKEEENPRIYHYLGLVYLALGEKELATEQFIRESERKTEEYSEFLMRFDLSFETPEIYETSKIDVYGLFSDPMLCKIFDLIKEFPMDSSLFTSLKETYGDKDSASLTALYFRSIYFEVFENRDFTVSLGLLSNQSKWEALLVFFVRGINSESKLLIKNALVEGKLDISKLPAYTRLLVTRYRREILSTYNKESFKALIRVPLMKLEALDVVCEKVRKIREASKNKGVTINTRIQSIFNELAKIGFSYKKGDTFVLSENILEGFENAERIRTGLLQKQYDKEFFIFFNTLLKNKRFEHAFKLAKRITALYEKNEAISYIKEILSSISLSDSEKFEILSEV